MIESVEFAMLESSNLEASNTEYSNMQSKMEQYLNAVAIKEENMNFACLICVWSKIIFREEVFVILLVEKVPPVNSMLNIVQSLMIEW